MLFLIKDIWQELPQIPNLKYLPMLRHKLKIAWILQSALGGQNYVLWGGREGYETILNTDMKKEMENLSRFLELVINYKHKIGFKGQILLEPKPHEPTKHQYDFDAASCLALIRKAGLEKEIKLNIEVNHATLSGHNFEHEVAYAISNDVLG